ncbi:MAG: 4Fe-4S binding protein [Thermoleophilia bacterium]
MADSTDTTQVTVHDRLALHLSAMGMGLPATPDLVNILERLLSPDEAEVMLALPAAVAPFTLTTAAEVAAARGEDAYAATGGPLAGDAAPTVKPLLDSLLERGLLYGGRTPSGEQGYALLQAGFGFPQTFFWAGEESEEAREMAGLMAKYANRHVLREMYGATPTKAYRYVPLDRTLSADQQAVFPHHAMGPVLARASTFAVAHCPCRMAVRMRGNGCHHSLEVCPKFDEMAEYVVERGLGRRITREKATAIVRRAADEGLVYFADNATGDVKHNCNCCGDACWNVGTIRRRKIPRDALMATYFLRVTDEGACTGCGICAEVCPVQAVVMTGGRPAVDLEWCIGCGVCVARCADQAARLAPRADIDQLLPADFATLHRAILDEKGGG